ncbi:hypothetical protein A0J61_07319 [Choanephora cucurbitarum]|uniref:Uncharacterized protein n=1 Tax=Choanephora cucurbitarum TaxID=101091 RepID=A0A1C7N7N6_9FUNG|nr:hypothetical protein A0J61_07319 [Choanephora cucurbitarum]
MVLSITSSFTLEVDDKNDLINAGLIFAKKRIRILPCPSIVADYEIASVSLTHIPSIRPDEIGTGLPKSLAPFGKIFNVDIFMRSGYAVLGKPKKANSLEIAHTVSCCESED